MRDMYSNIIKVIVVYEPTIERLSHQHLAYGIPAILLFFCFGICPTLLLCLHTTKLLKKCCTFRPRTQLMLTTFVDVFQSCYKDGLNGTYDFRFLSSFPMVMSLLLFSCFPSVTFHSRIHVYATLALLLFLISYFFAFSKPYKSLYMNFSLCFHFAIAGVLVTIISLWHAAHGVSNGPPFSLFHHFHLFTPSGGYGHCSVSFLNLYTTYQERNGKSVCKVFVFLSPNSWTRVCNSLTTTRPIGELLCLP